MCFVPPQKFKRASVWNGLSWGIINCGVEIILNDITCLRNSRKFAYRFRSY